MEKPYNHLAIKWMTVSKFRTVLASVICLMIVVCSFENGKGLDKINGGRTRHRDGVEPAWIKMIENYKERFPFEWRVDNKTIENNEDSLPVIRIIWPIMKWSLYIDFIPVRDSEYKQKQWLIKIYIKINYTDKYEDRSSNGESNSNHIGGGIDSNIGSSVSSISQNSINSNERYRYNGYNRILQRQQRKSQFIKFINPSLQDNVNTNIIMDNIVGRVGNNNILQSPQQNEIQVQQSWKKQLNQQFIQKIIDMDINNYDYGEIYNALIILEKYTRKWCRKGIG